MVVVFTKYDLLVWSKQLEEEEDDEDADDIDEETLRERSKINASNAFAASVLSLDRSTAGLNIPISPYINISGTSA